MASSIPGSAPLPLINDLSLVLPNSPVSEIQSSISFNQVLSNFNSYVVTPLNAFGLGGFVFDIEGDTTINLSADITDHFVENNTAIQDHIGIRPERIVLRNYVGELVDRQDKATNTPLQKVTQKLTTLANYLPDIAAQAQQGFDLLQSSDILATFQDSTIAQITNEATSLWSLTKNLNPGATRQQQAYLYFKALWQQQMLVSLQTPFEFVTNLAIESIVATQSENSKYISDFSITLKQMRFAATTTVNFDPAQYQSRNSDQQAPVTTGGKVAGTPTPISQNVETGLITNVYKPGQFLDIEPPTNPTP